VLTRRSFFVATASATAGLALGPGRAEAAARPCDRVTVFVAGDSTAATWPASVIPKAGWGQALPAFLHPRLVGVENLALSGASSKSFIEAGLLDRILSGIRAGDFLFISFGHNDEKTVERHTDPYTSFQHYLSQYVDGARARGAKPVLVTPVERRRVDAGGHAYASHGDYPAAMIALATEARVPVFDLTTASLRLWDAVGVEGTKDFFLWQDPGENPAFPDGVQDNTHFKAHGAIEVARLVVRGLVERHVLTRPLVRRLDRPVPDTALAWPETVPA
jgi:pectinesterase